jgi:hypothetical protein
MSPVETGGQTSARTLDRQRVTANVRVGASSSIAPEDMPEFAQAVDWREPPRSIDRYH